MKKKIRITGFSEPHLWYANQIGKVFKVDKIYEGKMFELHVGFVGFGVRHVLWEDAEIVQVATIKINNYRGFVPGDDIFTQDSVHRVVEPPKGQNFNGERGYWIKGSNDRPILVLHGEYLIEEYYVV